MANTLKIRRQITGLAAIPKAVRRDAFRVGIYAAGEAWFALYLPRHFTNQAYSLYGYQKRVAGYERAKRLRKANGQGSRAVGEVKPLVWSGASREQATKTKNIVAKSPSAERCYVLVKLNVPTLNFKNPKSQIDMRKELVTIIPAELAHLAGIYQAESVKELQRRGHAYSFNKQVAA